jgi:hypothetical protein
VVGFPLAVSTIALAQVLGCSPYFMTSLALFSLSRLLLALALALALTPILALVLTLTSASSEPSSLPPHLTSSTPFRLSFSSGQLSRLTPNNTRFGHKSRTSSPPPISQPLHPLTITRASAPPNRLFHWKRSRPVGHLPLPSPTSPALPPLSACPQVRRPPDAPPARTAHSEA